MTELEALTESISEAKRYLKKAQAFEPILKTDLERHGRSSAARSAAEPKPWA